MCEEVKSLKLFNPNPPPPLFHVFHPAAMGVPEPPVRDEPMDLDSRGEGVPSVDVVL